MTDRAIITSRRHALVEELRTIRDDRESPVLLLEGIRLVQEALQSGMELDSLVWTPTDELEPIAASAVSKRRYAVSESVFEAISDVKSPQGILGIAKRPSWTWQDLTKRAPAPILVLDGVQDPGNLAAIVRTAEAAGAAGLVTTPGTAHLFSPKALRGAMGSTLRLPCLEHRPAEEIHRELRKTPYRILAASMKSETKPSVDYTAVDWRKPVALLLGQEGQGISSDWEGLVDSHLHIPMRPPVQSLNVAAAAAILLYEFVRQNS